MEDASVISTSPDCFSFSDLPCPDSDLEHADHVERGFGKLSSFVVVL